MLEAGARLRKWDTVALRQKQQRAAPRSSSVTHNPLHGRGSVGSSARISGGPLKRAGTMPPTVEDDRARRGLYDESHAEEGELSS